MDMQRLKNTVTSIDMPEDMRQRILVKSRNRLRDPEEKRMKHTKKQVRWPAVMAAVLALCVCLPAAGMAMGNTGFFRDVMRGTAVVGMEYEQATGEIRVTAEYARGRVMVTADFLTPEKMPYSELEALAVGSCRVTDEAGKTVAEFACSDAVKITAGQAVMVLPVQGLAPGSYTLQIDSFVGSKKADQDLAMKGYWECGFEVK